MTDEDVRFAALEIRLEMALRERHREVVLRACDPGDARCQKARDPLAGYHAHDAASAYYRSRPLLLSMGLTIEDGFASPLGRSGGFSDGRDIGVVCNLPKDNGPIVLPMSGDVGSQFTPAAREFIRIFGRDEVAAAYFGDEAVSLLKRMVRRWGGAWVQVALLVNAGDSAAAIREMQKLEAAYIKRLLQGGPKGDFPTPTAFRNHA